MRLLDLDIDLVEIGDAPEQKEERQDFGADYYIRINQPSIGPENEPILITHDMIPTVITELQRIYNSKTKKNDGKPTIR
jgi:hypothetical protein